MKKFSREFSGYNRKEVNQFINEVITETEKIVKKLEQEKIEINELRKQIENYKNIEKTLTIALDNATSVGENIRRMANSERDAIILEAKKNASRIVNDALIQNEKISLKTEQAARNLRIFKNRLRSIVEEQLEVVDEIETLEIEE